MFDFINTDIFRSFYIPVHFRGEIEIYIFYFNTRHLIMFQLEDFIFIANSEEEV